MRPGPWIVKVYFAGLSALGLLLGIGSCEAVQRLAQWQQGRPGFSDTDVQTVAVVLTYEARVFPEPYRSHAFRAIAWTIRNRVATRYAGATGYSDYEHLLSKYTAYAQHRDEPPDPRAVEIAAEVLGALTDVDDITLGARHYVDNSYWTGTHEQASFGMPIANKYYDADVERLVNAGKFVLWIEWKSPPSHPRGLLFYGLYFFDYWPPPEPTRYGPASSGSPQAE